MRLVNIYLTVESQMMEVAYFISEIFLYSRGRPDPKYLKCVKFGKVLN